MKNIFSLFDPNLYFKPKFIMKKIVLLSSLIMLCLVISCSSDDDNNDNDDVVDSIIGLWTLNEEFSDNEVYELSNCDKKASYLFNTNNTLVYTEAYTVNNDPECLESPNGGTWADKGDNVYEFTFDDEGIEVVEIFKVTATSTTLTLEDLREGFGYTEVYIRAQ